MGVGLPCIRGDPVPFFICPCGPLYSLFPLPPWAAEIADLGRDPDPGRKLSVLLVGKNDQSKSKKTLLMA